MPLRYSIHWMKKRRYRPQITRYNIEYCIQSSRRLRDKHWLNAWNAVSRIPPSGRTLKVVYKQEGKTIKVITAFWLD